MDINSAEKDAIISKPMPYPTIIVKVRLTIGALMKMKANITDTIRHMS